MAKIKLNKLLNIRLRFVGAWKVYLKDLFINNCYILLQP